MNQNSISNSLLSAALVVIESALTLILKFDPNLRRAAYPLAMKNTSVCIRTYLPHVQVFATFTDKGVLLDTSADNLHREVDVVVNAYSHQLLQSLVSNDATLVNKITMRGTTETVAEFRHFLVQLGIASLFQGIIKTFKGKSKSPTTPKSSDDKPDYKARVEEQQQQLNALSIRNRQLEISIKESQSKQKVTFIAFIIAAITAIVALIGWLS